MTLDEFLDLVKAKIDERPDLAGPNLLRLARGTANTYLPNWDNYPEDLHSEAVECVAAIILGALALDPDSSLDDMVQRIKTPPEG
jgi:hypothetical protein